MNQQTLLFTKLKWLAPALLPVILMSCGGNDRPVYQGAEYYKNLEVPPDLTVPDTGGELRVPKPTDEAQQRFVDNNKLETIITPKFDGVRVVNYAGNSWIEIDNDVEHVWSRLLEFWQSEGIVLVEERPSLGFMETDWIERLEADSGFFRSIFQKFEPDVKDKFRVRLERFDQDRKTRLSIAHIRIERVVTGQDGDEFVWQSRPSNLEAEREIIARMALFAGKDKEDTVKMLDNYRPYSSLVKIDSTNTTALTMAGSIDFVWRRAMRALDRMQAQDIRQHKESRSINFVTGKISNDDLKIEEDSEEDELAESSWLMQLFSSTDEKSLATNITRQSRLEFTVVGKRVQIDVVDARETRTTDEDGDVYGTALSEQLRDLLAKNLE